MSDLSRQLQQRFTTRVERFAHGNFAADVLLPAAAEDLIDEREFDADERLPYWADLWPAARALTRHLLGAPPAAGRMLELGAGVALPSIALRWLGCDVLASDWYPDALQFARANADRLGLELPTCLLDWRAVPDDLGRFDLVLAADVVYEQRNADSLAATLPRLLAPEARALIADPGRIYLGEMLATLRKAGWSADQVDVREEAPSRVQIWQLRRTDS